MHLRGRDEECFIAVEQMAVSQQEVFTTMYREGQERACNETSGGGSGTLSKVHQAHEEEEE
ncbi:hypothetical protein Goari_023862, partial [Gossypium aridum]|nr:hypothetical protein [Gossypium aridum]